MSDTRAQQERALFDELRSRLGAALAGFTGQPGAVSGDPLPSFPADAALRWKQPLSPLPGAVWMLASEADWKTLGKFALESAGVEDSEEADQKSTYFEIVNQTIAGLAQALTKRLGKEVTPAQGAEIAEPPATTRWADVHLEAGAAPVTLVLGLEAALLNALYEPEPAEIPARKAADQGAGSPASSGIAASSPGPPPTPEPPPAPRTFDLLLDVELPVSVSFGRAQVPLRDVLKLSTGSIVELNRSILEPVEVIVNNCVVARGEVVVVEGNFGVRIQEVVSRQERLRTLQ